MSHDYSGMLFKVLQDVNISTILLLVSLFGVCPRDPKLQVLSSFTNLCSS